MQLRIGGLTFHGRAGSETFTLATLKGWEVDGVDMRRENIDRPAAHGSFSAPGFLTARSVSWSGLILTDSTYEQEHARRRLSGLLADGGTARLTVDEADARWADVSRDGEPSSQILVPGKIASYAFHAVAHDPRIYGDVVDFVGGTAAVNRGNFPATPRLMIGAGTGGYTVAGPNGRVVTVGTAPAAAHYIDFAMGGLFTAAGVRQPGAITVYQPWTVGPGLPGASATISGSRSLSQRVTDTFI